MTDVAVVIATRDRRAELLHTLGRLAALDDAPPVIVVDNASSDGTHEAVLEAYPEALLVARRARLAWPRAMRAASAHGQALACFAAAQGAHGRFRRARLNRCLRRHLRRPSLPRLFHMPALRRATPANPDSDSQ